MNAIAMIHDGRRDFDFFFGDWRVQHRLLKRRGGDCHEWAEFAGTAACRPLMGGICNVEEAHMEGRGTQGVAFRSFDIARRTWSIHWVSGDDGLVGEPVHGRFENGEGRFECDDVLGDREVRVRYEWTDITPTSARWTQSFSFDGGATFEPNWFIELTRVR